MQTLREIGREILTQDNAATSHPIFAVQEKVRDYGYDRDYGDGGIWINEDGDEVAGKYTTGSTRVYYRDRWEFVTACFTRVAARRYIDENQHNLKEPRIYVYSAYRNLEWQRIREALAAENDLGTEIERLRAIAGKLPLTANGVPVVPGQTVVWLGENGGGEDVARLQRWDGYGWTEDFGDTFSSLKEMRKAIRAREAAEAAGKEETPTPQDTPSGE